MAYAPGDVLMLQPENLNESVELALDALQLTPALLDTKFRLRPAEPTIQPPPEWLVQSEDQK